MDSQDTAPPALFGPPDYDAAASRFSVEDVIGKTVELMLRGAQVGLMDSVWLVRPGKPPRDLTRDSGAVRMVLDELLASSSISRAWLACEKLQPEIGVLVAAIRSLQRATVRISAGIYLQDLWVKVAEAEMPPPDKGDADGRGTEA